MTEEHHRETGNRDLQGMILESSEIDSFLDALTRLAVHELSEPGEEILCGITLLRHKRPGTVAIIIQAAQVTSRT